MSLSDLYCLRFLSQNFDMNGNLSSKGNVDTNLVKKWICDEKFILANPPKSADKELFGSKWIEKNINDYNSHENNLANLAYFTSLCISLNIKANNQAKDTAIYVSGGGINNKSIMKNLSELLPEYNILSIAEKGIDPKYKEAYAFALLAASNYFNVTINTKYITGAVEPYIIGETALWR